MDIRFRSSIQIRKSRKSRTRNLLNVYYSFSTSYYNERKILRRKKRRSTRTRNLSTLLKRKLPFLFDGKGRKRRTRRSRRSSRTRNIWVKSTRKLGRSSYRFKYKRSFEPRSINSRTRNVFIKIETIRSSILNDWKKTR